MGGVESYLKLVTVCNAVTQTRYLNNEENEKKGNLEIDRTPYHGHAQEREKKSTKYKEIDITVL